MLYLLFGWWWGFVFDGWNTDCLPSSSDIWLGDLHICNTHGWNISCMDGGRLSVTNPAGGINVVLCCCHPFFIRNLCDVRSQLPPVNGYCSNYGWIMGIIVSPARYNRLLRIISRKEGNREIFTFISLSLFIRCNMSQANLGVTMMFEHTILGARGNWKNNRIFDGF